MRILVLHKSTWTFYGASQLEHHLTTGKGGCKCLRCNLQIHGHQRRQLDKDDCNELPRETAKLHERLCNDSIYASVRDNGSDSDSDDDDKIERVYKDREYAGGGDINIPCDFMDNMKKHITTMLDSINNGPQGLSKGHYHGGVEATPNPGD